MLRLMTILGTILTSTTAMADAGHGAPDALHFHGEWLAALGVVMAAAVIVALARR